MRSHAYLGWMTTAALLGCDAKVDEHYRGEPMLSIRGSLVVQNPNVSSDLVPALAFLQADLVTYDDVTLHILDVDTQGEFPTNFTLNVMSPPPAAAMRSVPGLPSYAVGYITALPEQHGPTVEFPGRVDGAGSFSWCEGPGNTDCFRTIEQCIAGTDQCYRERARCVWVPLNDEGLTREVCDEILEQSGDPTILNSWAQFAGLSERHFALYVAGDAPASAARDYLRIDQAAIVAFAFAHKPITAGYHLVHARVLSEAERAVGAQCSEAAEARCLARVNALHGTNFESYDELARAIGPTSDMFIEHPYYKDYRRLMDEELYDAGCVTNLYEVIPTTSSVEITLGTDVRPAW